MGCSSLVTAPDEVSIEVDEDVVIPAELTITRNTRTIELLANLHAIRLIQASAFAMSCLHIYRIAGNFWKVKFSETYHSQTLWK